MWSGLQDGARLIATQETDEVLQVDESLCMLVSRSLPFFAVIACLSLGACASDPERPDSIITGGDLPIGVDSLGGASSLGTERLRAYPKGPYGEANPTVGSRVENLTFDGFVNPKVGQLASKSEFDSIELNEIRRSDNRYLVIHVSAYWCPPCLSAARDLEENRSIIEKAGATVVELLVDGKSSEADPKEEELEAWVKAASLSWPTATPGDERTRIVFPEREYIYLIDLNTMNVVWRAYGFSNDTTIGQLLVDELRLSLTGADAPE